MRINKAIINRAVNKARKQTICRYNISAIGLNHKGEVISSFTNRPRFDHKGGGVHAEMQVMLHSPKSLRSIVLCRVGNNGEILPIGPCEKCREKAAELGVKIHSIMME